MTEGDLDILHRVLETRGRFSHREHLELAWNYLRIYDADQAFEAVAAGIRQVAAMHGASDKYHETITRTWVHLVALHMASGEAESFDAFIAANPGLLERDLLSRHYSQKLISSREARFGWVRPDLRELPSVA